MTASVSVVFDLVTLVLFLAAAAVLSSVPTRENGTLDRAAKWFAVGAFCLYAFSATADILETAVQFDPLGDYEEVSRILFAPLILFSLQLMHARQQMRDMRASERAIGASRDMMISLVDTAPAGILVLDSDGRITFANETACDLLDLVEDGDTGAYSQPEWRVFNATGHAYPDFRAITSDRRMLEKRVRIVWPDGRWSLELTVSSSPLKGGGGTVAAFPIPSPSLTVAAGGLGRE